MGALGLIKANFRSIFIQRKLEAALAAGEDETVSDLISQSIVTILKAGLTPNQRRNLDELKQAHREEMADLIDAAFQRGWVREGAPNLSNAMDEVLLTVQERIREARASGECERLDSTTRKESFSESGRKRNALFWFVLLLIISILLFRYTSGWWTVFGYLAGFTSFGALLELFKKSDK